MLRQAEGHRNVWFKGTGDVVKKTSLQIFLLGSNDIFGFLITSEVGCNGLG